MTFSCYCGDEGPSLFNEALRTARKEHRCCECRQIIRKGDEYSVLQGLWDGTWDTYKTCYRCWALRESFQAVGYCVIYGTLIEDYDEWLLDGGLDRPAWLNELLGERDDA